MASTNHKKTKLSPKINSSDHVWIRKRLKSFLKSNGRRFGWRTTKNPYLILNTEILLQKTKAEDVDKFWPVIKRELSDPERSLKSRNTLIHIFKKLGLPKRKNWIIKTAKKIINYGDVPKAVPDLLALPGVGLYTACATTAFAYNTNNGLVDSNAIRLFERFWGQYKHHDLRRKVRFWLPISKKVGGANDFKSVFWGLLDLSALICKPRSPKCFECPLRMRCNYGLKNFSSSKMFLGLA